MNKIDKDELFTQLSQFLKTKGIDLQQGSYSRTIEKGCQLLADTINLSQQAVDRAKTEIEQKLEQARQVIHEKTAAKKPPVQQAPDTASSTGAKPPRIRVAKRPPPSPPERRRRKRPPGSGS